MIKTEYANAYSEVLEILKYIPTEDYIKIPENKIKLYKTNANSEYRFDYNPNKTLQEQNVSKIARGIIAIFFRDYWATEIQREKIIAKQKYERNLLEEEKREMYNPGDIFKSKEKVEEDNQILVINEEKWYKRILNYFRTILNK